jgi:NAD(P)H-hydrate epimerase
LPPIGKKDLVIDAIFGSGLSRPIDSGLVMAVIEHINGSGAEVVAVDIPSGLFADKPSTAGAIVKARHTVSFQLPKLAFMLSENHPFVGDWHLVPIGLSKKAIKKAEAGAFYITEKDIRKILKPRDKFSHKGTFGHALLLAGSYGKIGAALLAAKACLRSGAGLLTAHLPACGYPIMQIACPEAMVSTDKEEKFLSALPEDLQGKNAIGIGPGLGLSESSAALLLQLFQAQPETPMVIDADALNLMAKYRQLLDLLPSNSILTPHPKEFERLVGGKPSGDFERLKWQAAFASQYGVYVVCKGAHTSIASPDGEIFFNSTGNAGMATAGSGDVLTGVLLGLLAQGYMPREAALLGVFIHGLAGDVAKAKHGETSLIASDIIEALGGAFSKVERPENNTPNNEKAGKQVNGESKIKNM